jgi:carbohydrate kinase (thermoresistant glucokinase family)
MKGKPAIVVMGVAGCGKSTAGARIAAQLGVEFIEGDRLHPAANIEKMAAGIPLTDEDRRPWLKAIGKEIGRYAADGKGVVAACSALKRAYRDILRETAGTDLLFVHLSGTRELIGERVNHRTGHFFPETLLDSQFATLESPQTDERHVVADLTLPLEEMIGRVMRDIEAIDR